MRDQTTTKNPPLPTPTIVVLGLYRSGSSCAAGVLDRLGVHMGRPLMRRNCHNRRGYFEPIWLARQLRKMYDEPDLRDWMPREQRLRVLRRWHESQGRVARRRNTMLGVKHPLLCLAGDDLVEAWGERLKIIAVYRPLEECLGSLKRIGWWKRWSHRMLLEQLWNERERFLSHHDHLCLGYEDLLNAPEPQIRRIIEYLGLSVGSEPFDKACDFVEPGLRHVSGHQSVSVCGEGRVLFGS